MAETSQPEFRPARLTSGPSMVDLVVDAVREAILSGSMAPGSPVSIARLSEDFGISHIPVREALQRLEAEGLVELRRARSAIVSPIDIEEMRDIYRIRIQLEGDLVKRAARAFTDAELAELEATVDEMDRSEGDIGSLRGIHHDFHRRLVLPVASEWDLRVCELLWRASDRYLGLIFRGYARRDDFTGFVDLHRTLLAAARAGSGPKLRAALTAHLEEGMAQSEAALRQRDLSGK